MHICQIDSVGKKKGVKLHAGLEPAASRLEVLRATIALAELLLMYTGELLILIKSIGSSNN